MSFTAGHIVLLLLSTAAFALILRYGFPTPKEKEIDALRKENKALKKENERLQDKLERSAVKVAVDRARKEAGR